MKEKIIEILAAYKGVDAAEISSDATFADMGLDSLDVAELSMQIEDACGVTIDDAAELNTVDKLAQYIEDKANA